METKASADGIRNELRLIRVTMDEKLTGPTETEDIEITRFPKVIRKSTFSVDRLVVLRGLATGNTIPMSSDIVKACESQNFATVRDLLLQHKFGPNDLTEDYRPLLWVRLLPS